MILILAIDFVVVVTVVGLALWKGIEEALPFAAFVVVLVPLSSSIALSGLFDVSTQRVVIVTLTVLYFVAGKDGNPKPASTPLKSLLILAWIWMAVSTVNSVAFLHSLKAFACETLDLYLLYYMVARKVSRAETVERILIGIVAGMAVCGVFGLIECYRGWSVISLFPVRTIVDISAADEGRRLHSTYPVAHLFGAALAMAVPLALYLIATARGAGRKTLLWAIVLVMVWNTYKTTTRGPWLALPIGLIPLLLQHQYRKYLMFIALLTASVLIVRPGVYDTIKGQYTTTFDPDSPKHSTYQGRFDLLRMANRAISKDLAHMLWGYGPATWIYLGFEEEYENGSIHPIVSVDNAVAGFLEQVGYLGTLLYLLMLATPAIVALRNWRAAQGADRLLCLSLCGSMSAFLFMLTNLAVYGWGQQAFWIYIVMALSMTYPVWTQAGRTCELTVPGESSQTPLGRLELLTAKPLSRDW